MLSFWPIFCSRPCYYQKNKCSNSDLFWLASGRWLKLLLPHPHQETRGNRAPDVAPEILHDVDEELARVAHRQVKGLTRRSQLGGHRAQVTGGWGSRRSSRGGAGRRWRQSGMHGRRRHLLRMGEGVRRGHGWVRVRVLGDHHDHHGVVRQDAWGVRRHVWRRWLGHAVVVWALGGGVAVLAGRRWAVAAPQAAAGGVLWFAAAARTRVTPATTFPWGRLLPSTHRAAGTFGAAAALALASRRAAAPTPCGRREEASANSCNFWLHFSLVLFCRKFPVETGF